MKQPNDIIDFWFGNSDDDLKPKSLWFDAVPQFDEAIRERFRGDVELARRGDLDHWQMTPEGTLALLLLLDQFPRNIHRGRPEAFSCDWKAREVARTAVAKGFDLKLSSVQRWFIYLPFEHSEDEGDQARSVELFHTLRHDPVSIEAIMYAEKHKEVIDRFGRFPELNGLFGRETTEEEAAYLKQPGSSFMREYLSH